MKNPAYTYRKATVTLYVRPESGPLWDWARENHGSNLSTFIAHLLRQAKEKADKEEADTIAFLKELE